MNTANAKPMNITMNSRKGVKPSCIDSVFSILVECFSASSKGNLANVDESAIDIWNISVFFIGPKIPRNVCSFSSVRVLSSPLVRMLLLRQNLEYLAL